MADDTQIDQDFPTVVADGANAHFLEGFVSLLFYLDKAYPVYGQDAEKFETTRQTLFDVRLSINALKLLIKDLDKGLKFYAETGLIATNRDFWLVIGKNEDERGSRSLEEVDKVGDAALFNSFVGTMEQLSERGKDKVMNLFAQWLHENVEEIKKIAEDDSNAERKTIGKQD